MFAIFNSRRSQDRIACNLWLDWCTWSTSAILMSPTLRRFVNDLATVFTNHRRSGRPNSCQKQAISQNLRTYRQRVPWWYHDLPVEPCDHLSQSVATCWREDTFFFATSQYLSTHFSLWPFMSSKAVFFFERSCSSVWNCVVSLSPVVANFFEQLGFRLGCLEINLCIRLRAFPKHLICQWRWIWQIDFVLQNVPPGFQGLFFQHCFSGPRRHTEPFLCTRQDTFRVGTWSHPVFQTFLFPKNVG